MKTKKDASIIARHLSSFLNDYLPSQKTESAHTLKSYQDTFSLYIQFLEEKGIKSGSSGVIVGEKHPLPL